MAILLCLVSTPLVADTSLIMSQMEGNAQRRVSDGGSQCKWSVLQLLSNLIVLTEMTWKVISMCFLQCNYICCRLTGEGRNSGDNADGLVEWETCSKGSFAADPVCLTWMKRKWENIILHNSCDRWANHTLDLGVVINWSLIKFHYNSFIITSMLLSFCFFILHNPSYFCIFS